jgi:hypothetical protein
MKLVREILLREALLSTDLTKYFRPGTVAAEPHSLESVAAERGLGTSKLLS